MTELIPTPLTPALLRGAVDTRSTQHGLLPLRLPEAALAQGHDDYLRLMASQATGVRLALRTAATVVELDVVATRTVFHGTPAGPPGLFELLVDGALTDEAAASGGASAGVNMATGAVTYSAGTAGTVRFEGLPGREKDIEIWLPHSEVTELIALRSDAPVQASPEAGKRVWLHHGSSISQGVDAAGPTRTWPAVAASRAGVELVNLGLNGNALLDPFTARTLRDTRAHLISVKIGINLVNTDLMRMRAFTPAVHGFLDTIREGHPDTPLLLVSPIHSPLVEDTPGPTAPDPGFPGLRFKTFGDPADTATGHLTLRTIRQELSRIATERMADDPRLHYLDGLDLYNEEDFATTPLPDLLHPDTAGHALIGERFARHAFAGHGPFASR
ncbi:GDSL-type esterase/lipase family protein [Streptomyces sp. CL12-4]|uniref:GDSL-type esterase/lipase family protein n=1 Tax=Streptomyces sp. CL12-4 TaxID=2810306 RepID=UPI001EFA6F6A|nr:GDSL-type esterase/lipase family protein [Streptomyces sp. CL12-4]MCG8970273.1 lipase [Streptomyces sp. CL12-4]